jgi:hypothetical protein
MNPTLSIKTLRPRCVASSARVATALSAFPYTQRCGSFRSTPKGVTMKAPKFTKQHFIYLAACLAAISSDSDQADSLSTLLSHHLKPTNPNFDQEKFIKEVMKRFIGKTWEGF